MTGYTRSTGIDAVNEFSPLIEMYDKGMKFKAVDIFMRSAIGEDYISIIQRALPRHNAMEYAIEDAVTFFHDEIPAMNSWIFEDADPKKIQQIPVLHIRGTETARQRSKQREEIIMSWFPQTMNLVIQGAPHMIQITNSKEVAFYITDFIKKQTTT